jgi:hypothetical protein
LVSLGWFIDDGPKYITSIEWHQDDTQRDNGPAVLIEVFKVADGFPESKKRKARVAK